MAETAQEIHARMLLNTSEEQDRSVGSFVYDVEKAAAIEFEKQQKEIAIVQSKMDVENLVGDELTRFVYQRTGVVRKYATRALTTVIISGQEGSVISKGDMVATDTINFIVLEDAKIGPSGQITVFVQSELLGTIGNVPANSITRFPVTISGLINVYNPDSVTNGYEAENDEDLKRRYYNKLQRPGKSGNKYHYEEWAMSVNGVGDVKVFPKFNGPLTIKIVIVDANKQPAGPELIQRVYDYIESEMPFGVDELLIASAIEKPIDIAVELTLADGYTLESVKENIMKSIQKYLSEIAFKTSYVSYARIGNAIIDSEGVLDYVNLFVNGNSSNVPIGEEEVATMGVI